MGIARASRKRKKKKKKKRHPAVAVPPAAAPAPPSSPPAPTKYKHITGWDDSAGDGLVREVYEWVVYCSLLDHRTLGMRATLTVN